MTSQRFSGAPACNAPKRNPVELAQRLSRNTPILYIGVIFGNSISFRLLALKSYKFEVQFNFLNAVVTTELNSWEHIARVASAELRLVSV